MKKTLIAIAALAATGAFAQSTVTISGTMDMGLQMLSAQDNPTAAANGTGLTNRTNVFASNGSSTSAINIAGVEDLGAGMKASFFVETNPEMSGATMGTLGASTTGTLPANSAGTAFGGGQRFVGVSGAFGSVKMGSPNAAALEIIGMSNPFGTALGGGYSSSFSRIGTAATASSLTGGSAALAATANGTQLRIIRAQNSVRYDSPVFSGFGVSFNHAFANQKSDNTATSNGFTSLGLTYSAGPLNAGYTTSSIKNGASAVGALDISNVNAGNPTAVTLGAGTSITVNALAANYVFGATTVYAGWTSSKANVATAHDVSSMNIAAKYQVSGALAVSGNYVKRTDNNAYAGNGKLFALGADYALSKRTSAYARYEKFDTNLVNDNVGDRKAYGFGVRHTF